VSWYAVPTSGSIASKGAKESFRAWGHIASDTLGKTGHSRAQEGAIFLLGARPPWPAAGAGAAGMIDKTDVS